MDLGVIELNEHSTLPISPELEAYQQMHFSVLHLSWGYSQRILSPIRWGAKCKSSNVANSLLSNRGPKELPISKKVSVIDLINKLKNRTLRLLRSTKRKHFLIRPLLWQSIILLLVIIVDLLTCLIHKLKFKLCIGISSIYRFGFVRGFKYPLEVVYKHLPRR